MDLPSTRSAAVLCLLTLAACGGAERGDEARVGAEQIGRSAAGTLASDERGTAAVAGAPEPGAHAAARPSLPIDPQRFEELRNLAFRLVDEGAPAPECLAALELALALDGQAFGVNTRMGAVLVELKRYAEALQRYEAALLSRSDDPAVQREVAWLSLQLGDPARALPLLQTLVGHDTLGDDSTYLRALALDQLGRRDEARASLVELSSDATSALVLRGRMALEAGDAVAARSDFEAALQQRPDDQAGLRGLADACRRSGDDVAAARWDEVLTLLVALRDNRYAKPPETREDRKAQRQAGRASDYIASQLLANEQRLRRLNEIHPQWREGFVVLADLLRREDRPVEACATIEALLAAHSGAVDALEAAVLRNRYCVDED